MSDVFAGFRDLAPPEVQPVPQPAPSVEAPRAATVARYVASSTGVVACRDERPRPVYHLEGEVIHSTTVTPNQLRERSTSGYRGTDQSGTLALG